MWYPGSTSHMTQGSERPKGDTEEVGALTLNFIANVNLIQDLNGIFKWLLYLIINNISKYR